VDSTGNVFLTGSFQGSMQVGNQTLQSAGGSDVFLAKLDAGGNPQWAKSFGNAADQAAYAVATDAAGNVVLTGGFVGSINFGGTTLQSAGLDDVFVAKLDPDGNHLWSGSAGDAAEQDGYAIAVDPSGNVIVSGIFSGSVDFGNGALTNVPPTDAAMFLVKFAP
jgi:hypothetical protein